MTKLSQRKNEVVNQYEALGLLVARYRTEMNLSISDLSELTQVLPKDLYQLESGHCTLPLETLFRISNYLNIPPSALLSAIHEYDVGN